MSRLAIMVSGLILLSTAAPSIATDEPEGKHAEIDVEFVEEILEDLNTIWGDAENRNASLVLHAAGVLQEHPVLLKQLAETTRDGHTFASSDCDRALALISPDFLTQFHEAGSAAHAYESLQQRYILRGMAVRSAKLGHWENCQSLYEMSTAGQEHDVCPLYDLYVFSLVAAVDSGDEFQPPEFAIGYQLAIENRESDWRHFVSEVTDYGAVFANAGWAAGRIKLGLQKEGNFAFGQALAELDLLPASRILGLSESNATKTLVVLALAQLVSQSTDTQLLSHCAEVIPRYQRNVTPALRSVSHARLAVLYSMAGNRKQMAEELEATRSLLRTLDTFSSMTVNCILARHDVINGRTQLALEQIDAARSCLSPGARESAHQALFRISEHCANQRLSWEQTEDIVKPRNEVESVWTRLGWLKGS